MSNPIPDVYEFEACCVDILLWREVYGSFIGRGGKDGCWELSSEYNNYPRTTQPIHYFGLNIHLTSKPLVRGSWFCSPSGMVLKMTAVGCDIEEKIVDIINRYDFKLLGKNTP